MKKILISEILQDEIFNEELEHWSPDLQQIVIKHNQLKSLNTYAGTLLHEALHASSEN